MINTNENYDVIIIGGGTAGVIAATQAGRAGARTLLVEKTGCLGGTITNAGINFPGLFHAWGEQIIAGIGWNLVTECVKEAGGTLPDFSTPTPHHWEHQVRVDPYIYAALCDTFVLDSGVDMLLHTMLAALEHDDNGWQVTLCTKTGLQTTRARIVIDSSGDANAAILAGAQVNIIEHPQPATLSCIAEGYDLDSLDSDAINAAFTQAVQKGDTAYLDVSWNTRQADVLTWLRDNGRNANHFDAPAAHTSEGRTALEIEARRSMLRTYRFMRQQDGLHDYHLRLVAGECGVRETVTIVGEKTVTVEDYITGRIWPDAVSHAYYPIDQHTLDSAGLDCRQLQPGVVPTVPVGALLPRDTPDFIVAGRCLSSDRLANSALRVQATCMATGQAAGALAALSAAGNCDPRDVDVDDVRALLQRHDAIVPDLDSVAQGLVPVNGG